MILRFDILEPQNTGAPDYTLCGQAATVIPGAAVALSLKVNGQQVPFSVGADPNRTEPVVEGGLGLNELSGITQILGDGTEVTANFVGGVGEHVRIQIDDPNNYPLGGETIHAGTDVELTIEAPEDLSNGIQDHLTYANILEVFGFDIGNHGGVTGNPDASFYLIPYLKVQEQEITITEVPPGGAGVTMTVTVDGTPYAQLFTGTLVGTVSAFVATHAAAIAAQGITVTNPVQNVLHFTGSSTTPFYTLLFTTDAPGLNGVITTTGFLLIEDIINAQDEQQKPYANFVSWRKPLTDAVYFFDATSSQGAKLYKDVDGTILAMTRNGFYCAKECIEIQQINNIDIGGGCPTILVTCESSFTKHEPAIIFPTLSLQASCPTCGQGNCILIDTSGEAIFYVDYNLVTTYNVNDAERYPYDSQFFEYQVLDFSGAEVAQFDSSYTINPPDYVHNSNSTKFTGWTLAEIGDYMVKLTLSVPDVWECYETVTIRGCHVFEVEQAACNQYTIYNRSFESKTIKVLEMQDDKSFLEVDSIEIDTLSSVTITLSRDGIYQFVMEDALVTTDLIITVANFCNIRTCLHKHITNLMCSAPKTDCKEEDFYDFNALVVTLTTYFNQVNGEFISAPIFDALVDSQIDDLFTLKQYLDKMQEYCPDCNETCADCSNNKTSSLCKCH